MAQSIFAGLANAWDFAYGVNIEVPALVVVGGGSQAAGTYSVTVAIGDYLTPDGKLGTAFSTVIPIQIGEGTAAETVTPSAVSYGFDPLYGPVAYVTADFANAHGQGARISTGDFGIGEAQLYVTNKWGGGVVAVSPPLIRSAGLAAYSLADVQAFIHTIKSTSASAAVLNYCGFTGATSFEAASGAVLTATDYTLY